MKRLFIGVAFFMVVFLFGTVVAKQNLFTAKAKNEKKNCSGYVVIEFNKGVNCNGDTIKLTKKYGYYEIASN